jgi:plastocyanin
VPVLALAARSVLACPSVAWASQSQAGAGAGATGVTVQAGINDPKNPTIAVLEFMPRKVTVHEGATVTWSWQGTIEPHSVTFLAPGQQLTGEPDEALFLPTPPTGLYDGTTLVNSGLQPLGPTTPPPFSVTFGTTGSFEYHCVIHPNMAGEVDVVAQSKKADSPAAVTARGKVEQAKWLAEGRAAAKKLESAKPKRSNNDDGSTTWQVQMGTTTEHTDILAFSPAPTRVVAGDQVQFVNNSKAPHTATFSGTQPEITNPLDPREAEVIPGPSPQTLNTTDLFNSGELPPNVPSEPGGSPPPLAARSFTYVVPAAGNYPYYCILHVSEGMSATIISK